MSAQPSIINIGIPRSSLLKMLSSADIISVSEVEDVPVITEFDLATASAATQAPILNPAALPRIFLDASGNQVDAGSSLHVMTHFTTAGLIFDARPWKDVRSVKEAQEVAAQCDLLGRKGDWVIGQDYEMQLIVDRDFHAPAVNKKSFPNAPTEGLVYTSRPAAWSSGLVWFVGLNDGYVGWYGDCYEGLAVPVLRVPPSQ